MNFLFMKKEALYQNIRWLWKTTYFDTHVSQYIFFVCLKIPLSALHTIQYNAIKFHMLNLNLGVKTAFSANIRPELNTPCQILSPGGTNPALRCPQRNHS